MNKVFFQRATNSFPTGMLALFNTASSLFLQVASAPSLLPLERRGFLLYSFCQTTVALIQIANKSFCFHSPSMVVKVK